MPNLAVLHEAIAEAIPERECLVHGERRLTWRDVTERSRRLAAVLRGAGLGCRRERAELAGWESGQDHVALYLHNGSEYLEGMLGAYKARAAPFNVNYRYVDEELVHLFEDADARAVIFHARFAPVLARIRERLSGLRLWLQVEDGSGEALLPGARDYEAALAAAASDPPEGLSPEDLYVLYTGGTTGRPKGVLWRQTDILRAALLPGRTEPTVEAVVERARSGGPRLLPAPPFMHGAAHWSAFTMWHAGGTILIPDDPTRLDPADVWRTVEREGATAMTIVGDAFARPLLDALDAGRFDVSSLRLLTTGGAILSAASKEALLERIPGLRIVDALGSSESGQQAVQSARAGGRASTGDFELGPENVVLAEDLSRVLEPGDAETGWLARRGAVPLGYYEDPEKTERTFPVVEGVRYAVPGDRARVEADGRLRLFGRDSVTINTGGEKVFAEEVEHALKQQPAVWDAVVVGTPHERFGQQVTALVALRESAEADAEALREACAAQLARYKLPRAVVFVENVERAPSGKPDYRWAKQRAESALRGEAAAS